MRLPSKTELFASDERAFRTYWSVDEDYLIEEGVVKPTKSGKPVEVEVVDLDGRSIVQRYLPMARPELPFEFAKLASGTDGAVLEFVRNYGLLGYREAAETTLAIYRRFEFLATTPEGDGEGEGEGEETTPPLPNLEHFFDVAAWHHGDPLSWIFSHADTVRFVLDLHGALKEKDRLKVLLGKLATHRNDRYEKMLEWKFAERGQLDRQWMVIADPPDDDPVECARYIIAWIVNRNLRGGVSRELLIDTDLQRPDRKRSVQSVFQAESLIDCIYWQLADAIVGQAIRRCLFCGRFFSATTLKRKYCPPPMGYTGDGPCAQNDRARRRRERKRNERGQADTTAASQKGGTRGHKRKTKKQS